MNFIPTILADHTPWHTFFQTLGAHWMLVGGTVAVTLTIVSPAFRHVLFSPVRALWDLFKGSK